MPISDKVELELERVARRECLVSVCGQPVDGDDLWCGDCRELLRAAREAYEACWADAEGATADKTALWWAEELKADLRANAPRPAYSGQF